jgi:chemotaxis protein MotB
MFAFFVVMFASSQADKAKTKAVSSAVESALRDEQFASKVKEALSGSSGKQKSQGMSLQKVKDDPKKFADLTPSLQQLTLDLEEDIKAGRIQINMEQRGLVISLKEGAFFDSGDDRVLKERYASIQKLARVIKPLPNPVRLEGHTDSVPVHNSRFRSNWSLSAARSIAVLEILRDQFAVPEARMAVVGYADTLAMDNNNTEQGRARNRRVDLTILNDAATRSEAGQSGKA